MSVTFSYPSTGSVTSNVVLRNPQYGNSETYDNNVNFSLTMDGSVYSYKRKKKQVLLLTFNSVTKTIMDEFKTFYNAYIDDVLLYTDTLSVEWLVKFITNPLEVTTEIGYNTCLLYSFTLQLSATPN